METQIQTKNNRNVGANLTLEQTSFLQDNLQLNNMMNMEILTCGGQPMEY